MWRELTEKAKEIVAERGGGESVKEDAEELKEITSSKGSLADKAKAAVEAIKDPGDDDVAVPTPAPSAPAAAATDSEFDPAEEKVGDQQRGKHGGGGHGRGGQGRGGRGGRDGDPAV
jgi:hypothetical protein